MHWMGHPEQYFVEQCNADLLPSYSLVDSWKLKLHLLG